MKIIRRTALLAAASMALASPAVAQKSADTLRILFTDAVPNVDMYFNSQRTGLILAHQAWDMLVHRDPATFERMIAIKLIGTFNGIHTFAADMLGRGEGQIVNTASMAGLETSARLGAYTAAKFGVVGISEVLRKELEPFGVGVSVLCPGTVATGLPETTAKADGRYDPAAPQQAMPGIDPARVAARVVAGIKGNWPYILTHGERKGPVEARMQAILTAFGDTPPSSEL